MNQLRHEDSSQDSKYRNYFNESSRFISKNLQLFIVTPTILGGIWQLIELLFLSPSFVRFFSVTQLIADGILILLLLSFAILIYRFIAFGMSREFEENDRSKLYNYARGAGIITIGLYALYLFFIPSFFRISTTGENNLISSIIAISFLVMGVNSLYKGLQYIIYGLNKKVLNLRELHWSLNLTAIIVIISTILVSAYISFHTIKSARKLYKFPTGIKNLENINCYLLKEYNVSSENWTLEYTNDKFLFISIKEKKERLLIIEFSTLTDPSYCSDNDNTIPPMSPVDSTTQVVQDSTHN